MERQRSKSREKFTWTMPIRSRWSISWQFTRICRQWPVALSIILVYYSLGASGGESSPRRLFLSLNVKIDILHKNAIQVCF